VDRRRISVDVQRGFPNLENPHLGLLFA